MFLASKLRAAAPGRTRPDRDRPRPARPKGRVRADAGPHARRHGPFLQRSCGSWPASGSSSWARTTCCTSWPRKGCPRRLRRLRTRTRWWPAAGAPRASCSRQLAGARARVLRGRPHRPWATACPEISAMHMMCERCRYHVQPWVIPTCCTPTRTSRLPPHRGARRAGGVLRRGQSTPTGAGYVGRRDGAQFEPCGCGRTTPTSHRRSSATARSRVTIASPAPRPSSSSTRPSTS